jgi:hypothetical protein
VSDLAGRSRKIIEEFRANEGRVGGSDSSARRPAPWERESSINGSIPIARG